MKNFILTAAAVLLALTIMRYQILYHQLIMAYPN